MSLFLAVIVSPGCNMECNMRSTVSSHSSVSSLGQISHYFTQYGWVLLMPCPISLCVRTFSSMCPLGLLFRKRGKLNLIFKSYQLSFHLVSRSPMVFMFCKSSGQFLVLKTHFLLDIQDLKLPWFSSYHSCSQNSLLTPSSSTFPLNLGVF